MTDILSIVEKYAMRLEGPPPGRDSWFLDYVLRSPRQAGIHLTAGWHAINSLTEIYPTESVFSVWEPFAGMGAQALMVDRIWRPEYHVVQDYSQEAVDHLHRVLPGHIQARQADSYSPDSYVVSDLVVADFGDLTAWKTRDGEQHRILLDRIFGGDPKAVVFTDIACRYLHLHRERYEGLLGYATCASYPAYLRALLARLRGLYGYTLHRGFYDRWSTVMALVPETVDAAGTLVETPDSPVGLEIF